MAAHVVVSAGAGQTAAPGAALAVAPVVLVTDDQNAPVAGVEVDFAVSAGGGSVATTSSVTDSAGHATSGTWTLGSQKGTATLTATSGSLAPATLTAQALASSTDVAVTQSAYAAGQPVGSSVPVTVAVQSTYQVATVVATVADRSVPLLFDANANTWGGASLDLTGMASGPIELIVTATDIFGHASDLLVPLVLDRVPTITVDSPSDGAFIPGSMTLSVRCTDDNAAGCASLTAAVDGNIVASGTSSLSQTIDVSAYDGRSVSFTIIGTDSSGQRSIVADGIYVDVSPHLGLLAHPAGHVWDFSGTRSLYLDADATQPTLKIADSADGSVQTVQAGVIAIEHEDDSPAFLTASGAIYMNRLYPNGPAELMELRNGTLGDLGGTDDLRAAGTWAIYTGYGGNTAPGLTERNLTSGTSSAVAPGSGGDVAANGDVVYEVTGTIYRYRAGVSTALTAQTGTNSAPLTDGTVVVYTQQPTNGTTLSVVLNDGTSEHVLSTFPGTAPVNYGRYYGVMGGYVAYLKADATSHTQVWRHSASGEEQLTFFGADSSVEAVAPDGSVVIVTPSTGRRHLAVPGSALEDVGGGLGRVIVRSGEFVELVGELALSITP